MIKKHTDGKNASGKTASVYFFTGKKIKLPAELTPVQGLVQETADKEKSEVLSLYVNNTRYFAVFYSKAKKATPSTHLEDLRILGSKLCRAANAAGVQNLVLLQPSDILGREGTLALVEGIGLTNYEFYKYLKAQKPSNSLQGVFLKDKNIREENITELNNLIDAVTFTKNIVNEPVNHFDARDLAQSAVLQGKKAGFSVKVLDKKQIEKHKMGGLLAVNWGSVDEPTFSILEYKPRNAKNKKPLVLVGKGVVYDTGGNNLKINGVMGTMKCDMGGAAAVIGALTAIASNKLPLYVVGLIPSTDNRIGFNALVQDDIITMSDGTTVEVQNTDAEGRLILADALVYAKQYDPMLVIDLATLTGAAAAVTGTYGIGLMANDTRYKKDVMAAGEEVYERCAEFMMWREYNDLLRSDVADLKNIGGPTGGMITAAKFLEHFTSYDWIHLDIAGPAFIKDGARDYHHKGGSGVGVRLLYNFAKKMAGKR